MNNNQNILIIANQRKNAEFDSSNKMWNFYKSAYTHIFKRILTEECAAENGKQTIVEVGGEIDFNFKNAKNSKYAYFRKTIENDNSINKAKRQDLINNLNKCAKRHHSIENCSIMPCTGKLQITKQYIGNDRLDVFVRAIKEYYEGETALLLTHTTPENMSRLKAYLGMFEGVVDYCKQIYFINEELVWELVSSGYKAIDSAKRVEEYMELAKEFWRQKTQFFNNPDLVGPNLVETYKKTKEWEENWKKSNEQGSSNISLNDESNK